MKKLIYDSALLLLGCLLWTACNNDEDLTVFSTEGAKTELGQKIIAFCVCYKYRLKTGSWTEVREAIRLPVIVIE